MTWKQWMALAIIASELLLYVARIGRPREPVSGTDGVYAVIEWGVLAWLVAS